MIRVHSLDSLVSRLFCETIELDKKRWEYTLYGCFARQLCYLKSDGSPPLNGMPIPFAHPVIVQIASSIWYTIVPQEDWMLRTQAMAQALLDQG